MTNCSLKMGSWMVTKGSSPSAKRCGRLGPLGGVLFIAVVEPDELVAVDAVEGQDDHDDEVRDEQGVVPAVVRW